MAHILVAGGTGFLGQHLTRFWLSQRHTISILGRDVQKIKRAFVDEVHAISWDEWTEKGPLLIQEIDVVINLCGANIAEKRWSTDRKQILLDSRIETSQKIYDVLSQSENPPRWLNASGVGVYGASQDHLSVYDENAEIPNVQDGFLEKLSQEWESIVVKAEHEGLNAARLRFGVVLGKSDGALAKLLPIYKMGLGGVIGNGKQPFPWISLTDFITAVDYVLHHSELKGAVNIVAPELLSQSQFAKALGNQLSRPTLFWMPGFMVKIIFGEMGESMLLKGQWVLPEKLKQHGFKFQYPLIENALKHELQDT